MNNIFKNLLQIISKIWIIWKKLLLHIISKIVIIWKKYWSPWSVRYKWQESHEQFWAVLITKRVNKAYSPLRGFDI